MPTHLRIARPVTQLARSVAMYRQGLGLQEIGAFADHAGFDGVMLGFAGDDDAGFHFEFTHCRAQAVAPTPTVEDLIVLYLPDAAEWQRTGENLLGAGFAAVASFNPWWERGGRTYADADGYRTVLCNAAWRPLGEGAAP